MTKLTCLVLCAVAVTISSVSADASCREDLKPLEQECMKETGVLDADLDAAMNSGDVTKVNPCFWSCFFTKLGVLNDKGQYDLNGGLAGLKKYVKNDKKYAALESSIKKCETDTAASNGDAGCDRGAVVAACITKNTKHE